MKIMLVTFTKYIVVGIANTLLTLGISFILIYFKVNLYLANIIGYIIGFILSFILNSLFTFSVQLTVLRFSKFFITFLLCYFLNLLGMKIFLDFILISSNLKAYFAQLIGMVVYTLNSFFINKFWVMK